MKLYENPASTGAESSDRRGAVDQYARELKLGISDEQVKQAISRPQPSRLTANLITAAITVSQPDGDDRRSVRPGAA